ncbi:MAG TPA: cyclic nucleotide-binding domain-containing protein [Kofleriaceae bacterium]|nr:cyclic nucleotide-binding domain-containing protein [Kofleriaceae bacterium]
MPLTRPMLLALAAAFLSMAVVFVSKTFADTIFLARFGVTYVPHFFVIQAAGIIASSAVYGALLRRLSSPPIDLAILAAFAATAVVGLWADEGGGAAVFGVSLALSVLGALAFMVMWNAATAVVSGRRSRRFIPLAGAAATAGAVVGSFGSTAVVGAFEMAGLAPVIAVMALLTGLLRVFLVSRSGEWGLIPRAVEPRTRALAERQQEQQLQARADTASPVPVGPGPDIRLVRILAAATVIEACLTAFVEFGFKLEVVNAISGRDQIGVFFSVFYGASNAALLLLQIVASSRLLATRSLRFSLALEPAILFLTTLAWTVFPTLALAAVARGAESVMKFGIARPAQEVALTPLTEVERKRWKVLLRGVYNQGGSAVAGLLLIGAAPFLDIHSVAVPIAAAITALMWLALQLAASNRYLDTLGSALGLRRLSLRDDREELLIDRDGLARVVQLAGSSDETSARFGRELLATYAQDPRLLIPYIGMGPSAQRETLYRLLAARPHRACAASLRAAMAGEADEGPAAACLDALAAHADGSQVAVARKLAGDVEATDADGGPLSSAAWRYLAQVGALDDKPAERKAVVAATLAIDGARAADILAALVGRRALGRDEAEQLALEAAASDDPERRRQGLHACAGLGGRKPLGSVIEALGGREPWLDEIVTRMDPLGLSELLELDIYRKAPTRVKARVLRGLRSSDLPEVADLVGRELVNRDPEVRELAARTMLRRARDHGEEVPRDLAERALSLQLDRFELYVRARPGYASAARESHIDVKYRAGINTVADLTAEAFFIDELERRTERSLTRLCAILALFGNPSSVYAAERALRASTFKRRRQALDIMQEVARGRDRTRILQLLELYLLPAREPPRDARQKVCDMDPWMARCASFSADPMMGRLWALRATLLFDDIDGELLDALAVRSNEVDHAAGDVVVVAGDPADALYVVMRGVVTVEREGKVVAQLGRGQAFGELALVDGLPRQATVRSEKPSRLLRLPRDTFDEAMTEHPELGLGLVRGLSRWLRQGDGIDRPPEYRR